MATIDVLGTPHTYSLTPETGATPVLVFIHGWLLSRTYWQPVVEQLAPDYQCLTYDLRGFGESQPCQHRGSSPGNQAGECTVLNSEVRGEDGIGVRGSARAIASSQRVFSISEQPMSQVAEGIYTPAAYAQDLSVLLQQLQISQAWLIGHSLGGSIALWGAAALPDCIQGVICLNSGGGIYLKEEFERFRSAGQQLLKLRPRWLCHLPFMDWLFTRASVAQPISMRWGKQRVVDFVTANAEAAAGTLLESTTEAEVHRLPQLVAQLQQPVYFIAGAKDPVMEPKYVQHLASFHPLFQGRGQNVIEIPQCGHMAMVEQPQAVSQEIKNILSQFAQKLG